MHTLFFVFRFFFLLLFFVVSVCPSVRAAGMTVFALGVFCCTLPHFIYGDELLNANNAFYGGKVSDSATSISTSMAFRNSSVADVRPETSHLNLCRNGSSIHTDGNIDTFFWYPCVFVFGRF